jgi:hypothetical protein
MTSIAIDFTADPNVAKVAEAYALDAIDIAGAKFGVALDFSEASVERVEEILNEFCTSMSQERPPDEIVWRVAKAFGSYLGEVFRRVHGGTWGMVTMSGERFPGFRATSRDVTFWPWGRARNRLMNGPEDNVWHYYQSLLR